MTRICIVGAGAIGGWLGTLLGQLADVQLSVLARGTTLAAVQKHGLQLDCAAPDGAPQRWHAAAQASDNAADLGVQDIVIISVKAPALAAVAAQIVPMLGQDTVVLSAMNGVPWWFLQGLGELGKLGEPGEPGGALAGQRLHSVDATGDITRHIQPQHIIGCVVHASCATSAPGVAQHHFGNSLIIGEPSGEPTLRVQKLLALLQRAGFAATLSPRIQRDIWYKLWGNMTMNPISAITGATTDKILDDDLVLSLVSSVMLEAKTIGAKIGITIDQQPEDRHAVTRKLGAFKTSMLQDIQSNKPVELDALVGAVQELGRLTQVPTPFTDALFGLARLHARTRGLYNYGGS